MKQKIFKSLWGMPDALEQNLARIAEAGYAGVEVPLPQGSPSGRDERGRFRELLAAYRLEYIPLIFTAGDHARSFATQLEEAAAMDPVLVISHSGRDAMPFEEQAAFFRSALQREKSVGVPVAHETHRGRILFTPWATARLLEEFDNLKLTADFSHWCCVCESLLEDQADALRLACRRAIHVHGRVGYAQGPQVPDPGRPSTARRWRRTSAGGSRSAASANDRVPRRSPSPPSSVPPTPAHPALHPPAGGRPVGDLPLDGAARPRQGPGPW